MSSADRSIRLLEEVSAVAQRHLADRGGPWLQLLCDGLSGAAPRTNEAVGHHIVDTHLTAAVALAGDAEAPLAQALLAAAPSLTWCRAYDGVDGDADFVHFRDNYAYTRFIGPDDGTAPFTHPDIAMGFSLQAPKVRYGLHHHPAVEIYGVIGGTAEWKQNDDPWAMRPPGSLMIHEAHDDHAMTTHDEPLVTWWAWVTDVSTSVPTMS